MGTRVWVPILVLGYGYGYYISDIYIYVCVCVFRSTHIRYKHSCTLGTVFFDIEMCVRLIFQIMY